MQKTWIINCICNRRVTTRNVPGLQCFPFHGWLWHYAIARAPLRLRDPLLWCARMVADARKFYADLCYVCHQSHATARNFTHLVLCSCAYRESFCFTCQMIVLTECLWVKLQTNTECCTCVLVTFTEHTLQTFTRHFWNCSAAENAACCCCVVKHFVHCLTWSHASTYICDSQLPHPWDGTILLATELVLLR